MKKSLVALAVLAAAGAASAQSTVSIGGQLDAGLANTKNSAGATTLVQGSGIHGASRMWFTGTEDMGGGNKANFRLEMQPGINNGSTNANLFNRGAWLGLQGGWGEFRMGRQSTVAMGVICTADLIGCYSGFSGGGILFGGNGAGGTRWISGNPNRGQTAPAAGLAQSTGADFTRVVNGLTYLGTFGAVSTQVQYAFGGGVNTQANGNGREIGLQLAYAQGPLYAGLSYQTANADATVNATGKQTTLGVSYDLGMAKVGAAYQSESASGVTNYTAARAWALTAAFPMGPATPYVKLGQHKTNGVGSYSVVNATDSQVFNLGSRYALSKRTNLYIDYAVDNKGNSGIGTNVAKPTQLSMGVQHNF
ncbi:MAG: hypothetical protein RLZZ401_1939 [Pseudomonadota bacterium]|jgi:predicted porin